MSIVSTFARTMAEQAMPMIGEETVTIGATSLSCVLAEVDDGKDYSTGGFEVTKTLQAVCRTSDMPASMLPHCFFLAAAPVPNTCDDPASSRHA